VDDLKDNQSSSQNGHDIGSNSLSANHLQKTYGRRRVVDDVSIGVKQGEVVGLLGANGAGKTTTFYMMVGLERTEHGNIFLNGQDVTVLPMYLRARLGLGYLPQEPSIFRKMTAEQNLLAVSKQRSFHAGKDFRDSIS
jgi:lipopolysaccharide export system ATP-binding protein